ncbi:MAG: response regulator transcription factor [Gammaproteobacteria bacterium]|nr:response regulator transcription factor [Gammaproteobacteria bacterium]MDH5802962.1 response regulator transcription factor [Gammaproteobacteria bacterium]
MRLLLVEDNESIGKGLYLGLNQSGYAVDWVRDGETAESAFNTNDYDVAVLDLGLPRKSGMSVLAAVRANGNRVPIVVLTAKDTIDERITGLDTGADDYMVKPFDLDELGARLRAVMRRNRGRATPVLLHGDLELDPAAHSVRKNGAALELTPKAFDILHVFMENQGQVVSRSRLEESLYSWKNEIDSNAIEVHIHQIRKKLGPDIIRTVRGSGYIMDTIDYQET